MNALEIKNFSKSYDGKPAVKGLNLTVPKGEFFGLLGQNGAGKTTTINCITGIGMFDGGSIEVMGMDVQKEYQKTRALIGLSAQEFNVDIFAPIERILDFVGGYFGMKKDEREKRIAELFDLLNLNDHKGMPFAKLSGGLKRRVVLARALMHNPEVLILDEPTAGIDVRQRKELWNVLQSLHKAGKTIILTSHYLEEVEFLCSRVGVMHNGELIKILNKNQFKGDGGSLEKTFLSLTE